MQIRALMGLFAFVSLLGFSFHTEMYPANVFGSNADPTFLAVASAVVDASRPNTVLGQSNLMVDGVPEVDSYIRFDVTGLSGPAGRATLQVTAAGISGSGYFVYSVADNSWDPTSITFATAPAMGAELGSSGTFGAGMSTSVDVTSAITGNGSFSFALTSFDPLPVNFSGVAQLIILPAEVVPTASGPALGSFPFNDFTASGIPAAFPGTAATGALGTLHSAVVKLAVYSNDWRCGQTFADLRSVF